VSAVVASAPSPVAAGPSVPDILRSWDVGPVVVLGLLVVALAYVWIAGAARRRTGRTNAGATRCFMAGLAVIAVALVSPIGPYSDRLLSVHMVEHILLTMVAPPLLLLGAPVTVALQAASREQRRRFLLPLLRSRAVRVLSSPVLGWALLAGALWGSHFSGLYELTLENGTVHRLEHALYLVAALLFWRPVVARDPAPGRLSGPARLFYLFVFMPVTAFLGLAMYGTDRLLYPHYAVATAALGLSPLADQHLAGALMWISGMVLFLPALGLVLFEWLDREDREASRTAGPAGPSHPEAGPSRPEGVASSTRN
jgi:cytochrome c oxidase assembly factor CtaG